MSTKYSHQPGRIFIEKDGIKTFDTEAFPLQFFPLAEEITTNRTITFPDFNKANSYGFARGVQGSNFLNSCSSFITLPYQTWGPSTLLPPPDNLLAPEIIGTVPGNTDILISRVRLNRTVNPSAVNGNVAPITFETSGAWTQVDGGGLIVEQIAPYVRMIKIVLSPTLNADGTKNVLLERHQSVQKRRYNYWRADGNPAVSGWTFGGTNGRFGHIVSLIQSRGPVIGPEGFSSLARNGNNACSLVDNTNYSSVYVGDIKIIPGVSNIEKEEVGGGKALVFTDQDELPSNNFASSSFTFSNINIGIDRPDRQILVAAISLGNTSLISNVTIGGTAATLVERRSIEIPLLGYGHSAGIYRLSGISGNSANVVVNFPSGQGYCRIYVFATYGLNFTPFSSGGVTFVSTTPATTLNLSAPADGYAMAVAIGRSGTSNSFTGISNSFGDIMELVTPSRIAFGSRGFQKTTGTTLPLSLTTGGGNIILGVTFN